VNNIDRIYSESGDSISLFAKGYLEYLGKLLAKLNAEEIEAFVKSILAARN